METIQPKPGMRRLDPAQAAAAKGAAPVQLTLAGPGSGKTSTLTGRFVHLVRQGVDPARILAMTYTKKASDEMGARIARLLGLPDPRGLHISTFHAFAYRYLKRDPGSAGLAGRLPAVGRRRTAACVQLPPHVVERGRRHSRHHQRRQGAPAHAPTTWSGPPSTTTTRPCIKAAEYFRVYEEARRNAGAIDFSDMVPLMAAAMARDEGARRAVTGAFDHLLVDEYQDVNPGQIRLIDHFVNDGVQLWAVGDDDQTLYEFRASDVRYILEFAKKYPGAQVHVLDHNYRSSPEIVEAAKRVIRNNRMRCDKDYKADRHRAGRDRHTWLFDPRDRGAAGRRRPSPDCWRAATRPSNWRCSTARARWGCRSRPR